MPVYRGCPQKDQNLRPFFSQASLTEAREAAQIVAELEDFGILALIRLMEEIRRSPVEM